MPLPSLEEILANSDASVDDKSRAFLDAMGNDPDGRKAILAYLKKRDPDRRIPELDAVKEVNDATEARLKPIQEELEAQKKAREEERSQRFWDNARAKADAAGLDFEEVQKFMTDEGIMNPEIAVNHLLATKPQAEPDYQFSSVMPGKDEEDAGLLENPRAWAQKKAHESIEAIRRQQAA